MYEDVLGNIQGPLVLIEGGTGMGKSTLAERIVAGSESVCALIRCEKENITPYRDVKRLLADVGFDLEKYLSGDIMGLIVITKSSLLAGEYWKEDTGMDTDILAAMIDAVRMFIRDSMGDVADSSGQYTTDIIAYGSNTIMARAFSGGHVVLMVRGAPSLSIRLFLERLAEDVEALFSRKLAAWHGDGGTISELSEFLRVRAGSAGSLGGYAVRGELVTAVTEHLRSRKPVTLVIDNMHWIDPSSLDLINDIIGAGIEGVVVVGLYNPDFARRHGAFMEFLKRNRHRVVKLRPLDVDGVADLVMERYGDVSWARDLAAVLVERTGGVPLLVTEHLRAMEQEGVIERRGGRYILHMDMLYEWEAPLSVDAVVEERISSLPAEVRAILKAASVMGDAVDASVLSEVLDMGEAKIAMALELAEERGIVDITDDGFKFTHRLYRTALYSSLKGYQKKAYHSAVAGFLERMGGEPEDIAYHHYMAGNGEKALPYLREAVEKAERFNSMLELRKLSAMGAEVAKRDEDLFYFLIKKAMAENVTGRVEEAVRDARAALQYAASEEDRLEVFLTMASSYFRQGLYGKVLELIEEFRDQVGEKGRFHLDVQEAMARWKFGELSRAVELVERHLEDDLSDRERMSLYRFYGVLKSAMGDDAGAETYYLRSLEMAERMGDIAGMSAACNNVAIIYVGRGDVEKAKEYYERALEYDRAINDLRGMSLVMINLAELMTSRGEYEKALEMFLEIRDIKERIHDQEGLGFALHGLLYTNMLLGNYDEALRQGEEALKCFEKIGFSVGQCFTRVTLSLLHTARGEDERAVALAEEGASMAVEMGDEEMRKSAAGRLRAAKMWMGKDAEAPPEGEVEDEDAALLWYAAGLRGDGRAAEVLARAAESPKVLNGDLRLFMKGLSSLLSGDAESFQEALSSLNSPYYIALLRRASTYGSHQV